MALSLLRAPILPLALMGGVAALVWTQRRKPAATSVKVPDEVFPEPGGTPTGTPTPGGTALEAILPPVGSTVYCTREGSFPNIGCALVAAPNESALLTARAAFAAPLTALETSGTWLRVQRGTDVGWVPAAAVGITNPRPPPPPPPPPPPLFYAKVQGGLNLREAPRPDARLVRAMEIGESVVVYQTGVVQSGGLCPQCEWWHVLPWVNGVEAGYMLARGPQGESHLIQVPLP